MRISEITNKQLPKADGDCFVVAGKFIMNNINIPATLVHAMVTGQGKIKGIRHAHAWVEVGDVVIDQSNGRNIIMRINDYYKLGKVSKKKGQYAAYDRNQALEKFSEYMTYGPWDLDV